MTLDMSLTNASLYCGLEVTTEGGRLVMKTPPDQALGPLVANLTKLRIDPEEVVLTGGMAIWAYLVVFHYLHGKTKRIYYVDGRGQRVLVAAHG